MIEKNSTFPAIVNAPAFLLRYARYGTSLALAQYSVEKRES